MSSDEFFHAEIISGQIIGKLFFIMMAYPENSSPVFPV
jgi:hypothetical protein